MNNDHSSCPLLRKIATNGFTLMEVLVAMFIVATSVTVFLQLISGSMNLERRSRDKVREVIDVDRLFADLQRQDVRGSDFPWSGDEGGLRWQLRLIPLDVETPETDGKLPPLRLPLELYRYELRYAWQGRSEQTLVRYVAYPGSFFNDRFRTTMFSDAD